MVFKYKKNITTTSFDRELDSISERIQNLNLAKGFFEFIIYTISELLANVKEHAKTNQASLVLIVNQKKGSVLIGVADQGIGLRQSYLSRQIYVKDDAAAIEFALSGLSTKNLRERGFGLYSIRKFVERLAGKMIAESGSAKAFIQKNKINFQQIKKERPGTMINLESPIKKIDFYKIIG